MNDYDLSKEEMEILIDEGIHLVGWLMPTVLRRTIMETENG
tara:strand:- start:1912 stop:2034 length:123 start_codon:yes stop_codon:yes gene_type:complete